MRALRPSSLIWITSVAVLVLLPTASLRAQTTSVGNVPALAGSVASVPVDVSQPSPFAGLSFRLDFDPKDLSFFKVVLEGLGANWFANTTPIGPGAVRVTLSTGAPQAASGRVASLVFAVSQSAVPNASSALRISEIAVTLADGSIIGGTGSDGAVVPKDQLAQPVPPLPPTVTAAAESSSSIRLTWNGTPGATSFILYSGSSKIYEGSERTHVAASLTPATQYCFSARAVGAAGQGTLSSSACATTKAQCVTPATSPSLVATPLGTSRVELSWAAVPDASEYRVLRGSTQVYLGSGTTFTDENLTAGTDYCYTIQARSTCGSAPVSAQTCATTITECTPPATPAAPNAKGVSPAVSSVEWDEVAGATRYRLTRGAATIYEGADRGAVDIGLLPDTQYCYTLVAMNDCGERSSIQSCATTGSIANDALVFTHYAGPTGGADSRDGLGTKAGFSRPASLAIDSSGNVYVADTDNQTIRKIAPDGFVSTFAGQPEKPGSADGQGSAAQFFGPEGIAVDAAGNVYVADAQNATIRRITPGGTVSTFAGSPGVRGAVDGPIGSSLFHTPVGVAVDSSGRVWVSDLWNQTIRRISNGQVETVAGATGQAGSADGTGSAARFNLPTGISVDPSGNVFVADFTNHTIRRVTQDGVVTTVAGTAGQSGKADGTGSAARFAHPTGVAADSAGNVFVADQTNGTIRKIAPGGVVTTFAGSPDNIGSTDGTGSAARFFLPKQVAVDGSRRVWVADTGNATIRRISTDAMVTTVAGTANLSGFANGAGTTARFNSPQELALEPSGALVIADFGNHMLRRISTDGTVSTLAGTPETPGTADGPATSAQFRSPLGVAVDSSGNAYAADWGNHTIRKIAPDGTVTTFAGSAGQIGTADGTGASARFNGPRAVAAAPDGTIYVTDRENHTIRRILPSGVVSTVAGMAGQSGNADGTGAAARFTFPHGLDIDDDGNLIVTDWGNHTIRRVSPAGVVTTLAGSPGVAGVADGTGAEARFFGPQGVMVDAAGDAWITDSWNHTIRRLSPDKSVTTAAGMPRGVGSRDGLGATSRFSSPIGVAITDDDIVYVADTLNHSIRRGIPCPADSLCLGNGRFALSLRAKDPRTENTGNGLPIPQTDLFGYFAIPDLTGNPDNPEVFVKMLDGRLVNGSHWVFYGGLTDFEYDLVVTDTATGSVRVYPKPGFEFCGGADTSAFSAKSVGATLRPFDSTSRSSGLTSSAAENAGPCDPATEICLLDGRFALSLGAKDPRTGNTASGLPIPQSDLFGYFSIPGLTSNPDNPEIFVKMLDGQLVNGHSWVFYGGLTDFEVTLAVRDTQSGTTQTYSKEGGSFCGGADTTAF